MSDSKQPLSRYELQKKKIRVYPMWLILVALTGMVFGYIVGVTPVETESAASDSVTITAEETIPSEYEPLSNEEELERLNSEISYWNTLYRDVYDELIQAKADLQTAQEDCTYWKTTCNTWYKNYFDLKNSLE